LTNNNPPPVGARHAREWYPPKKTPRTHQNSNHRWFQTKFTEHLYLYRAQGALLQVGYSIADGKPNLLLLKLHPKSSINPNCFTVEHRRSANEPKLK
jgi:hypothetical protein